MPPHRRSTISVHVASATSPISESTHKAEEVSRPQSGPTSAPADKFPSPEPIVQAHATGGRDEQRATPTTTGWKPA